MTERTQDVEGLLKTLSLLVMAAEGKGQPRGKVTEGCAQTTAEVFRDARDTIRALRSERDEAERMAREWVSQPPENFAMLPRKTGVEILCFGLFLYAKGLRAALSRKDAALREWEAACGNEMAESARLRQRCEILDGGAAEPAESEEATLDRPWERAFREYVASLDYHQTPIVTKADHFRAGWDAALPTVEDVAGMLKDERAAPRPEGVEDWTDGDSDALADIIWWIKGRLDAGEYRPFGEGHVEALRKARVNLDATRTTEPETP